MIIKAATGFIAAGLVFAAPALAQHEEGRGYADADGYDYAEVIDVDPIYREVRVSVPRQECRTEVYDEPARPVYRPGDRPAAGPMILGGLIGAVLGHQFGHGRARDAGTVAGAVVGAAIGHDAAQRRAGRDDDADVDAPPRTREQEVCRTRYEERIDREVDGYRITYRYNGRTYCTQMPYEPGERIRVHVTVDPVGA
jgi:uncharacterized protein YcfJ